ncbi:MAG: PQQ-binding-like beta-propeller repeat protein [Planctomycetes bacterium]|nr:PQQ-binding-like beta-propeller repeat protein [Planctomycetota bacterium]
MRRSAMHGATWAMAGICAALAAARAACGDPAREASEILRVSGIRGGIIVHLGCGDGRVTAALRADERYAVHGLDADPAKVDAARIRAMGIGLHGQVSFDGFDGSRLPYVDDLVNLVVADGGVSIAREEVLRVVAPGGAAMFRDGEGWAVVRKPRPAGLDEWSHFLHDAGNNAVARDGEIGPPRSLRWVAPPLWLRSHETPSGFEALVSSGGRIFYIFDEGLIGITDQRLPERWSIVCRDAFNGKLLWKRPLASWGWPEWARERFAGLSWTEIRGGRTVVPDENQRRLVADGDRLYATLGYRAPLSILDAATGAEIATVEGTEPVREIIAAAGIVIVSSGLPPASAAQKKQEKEERGGILAAVRGKTGAVVWKKATAPIKSLFLAADGERVIFQEGADLVAFDLETGDELWRARPKERNGRTLVLHAGTVLIRGAAALEARDATSGGLLWHRTILRASGGGPEDLFVADGLVWPGMFSVNEKLALAPKSPDALALGYDLKTGEERRRILVPNLRSPEHHHRCYRNKATERYLVTAMEGMEFLDIQGDDHSQDNWLRGACRLGIVPSDGLIFVPPDQCFCEPGAKLLGLNAVSATSAAGAAVPNERRLAKGPAFGPIGRAQDEGPEDWPTYRHDPARHGTTPSAVPAAAAPAWRVMIGGVLSAPVVAAGRVYVAARDAYAIHALDMRTGERIWTFVTGGRVDSPPTIYRGLVLAGSADGYVYALRASDGALAWRFLAAPADRRIASDGRIESLWPVHGSVLVRDGIAYVAAGRSTYLDGGIRLYALDPAGARILNEGVLEGPFPDRTNVRDVSFYVTGANSDVLVAEGDAIYLRQKRLTPSLEEVKPEILSSKGEADVGLHVFSTSGLLDGSWYNRTYWMYAKRWPGFQLANQAPKSGQLLVVDEANTYAVKVFYRRNVHSTMFFPGKEGYLLFADRNANEPQIVGEDGARKPIPWLPQSSYLRNQKEGDRPLDSPAFGLDKMIGYTRAEPPLWATWIPVRIRAMVKAGGTIFAAGPPDVLDSADPYAAFEGRKGARLVAVSAADGRLLEERDIGVAPVFDGLIAAAGRLFASLEDGSLACFAAPAKDSAPKREEGDAPPSPPRAEGPRTGKAVPRFEAHRIGRARYEPCGVGDFNGDGRLDIVSGPVLYLAPDWKAVKVRSVDGAVDDKGDGYYNDFMNAPLDVDGDGLLDIVSCDWFCMCVEWHRNNGAAAGEWETTLVEKSGNHECGDLVDIDGDGKALEILVHVQPTVWWEVGELPGGGRGLVKHVISETPSEYGGGVGDVNGDGRPDVLRPTAWYEAPADPRRGRWKEHPLAVGHLEEGKADHTPQILVMDVNADGRNDIVTSSAHGRGIFWYEQLPGKESPAWRQHVIDKSWTQAHALALADLDGDGDLDLVAGKRFRAHNGGDPGGSDPPIVCWYELQRGPTPAWTRHVLSEGEMIGAGLSIPVVDLDGDGDLDIVVSGKWGGPVWFENKS